MSFRRFFQVARTVASGAGQWLVIPVLVLFGGSGATRGASATGLQDEIARGLRWYFHWERAFPESRRIGCRGVNSGSNFFAYCDPGGETLDFTRTASGEFEMRLIASTRDDFATQLRLFDTIHGAPTGHFLASIGSDNLARYEFDRNVSEARMMDTMGYMQGAVHVYAGRGIEARCLFPRVSKGDPFYEVYLLADGRLDSVWRFPVVNGKARDFPDWTYDVPHHNIPDVAPSLAKDASRWFGSFPTAAVQ